MNNGTSDGGSLDIVQPNTNPYTYEVVSQIAQWLKERTKLRPKLGIICGTGLAGLTELLSGREEMPYHTIPHFPRSTVEGHRGSLLLGTLATVQVICFSGRFHYFEGYSNYQCTVMIRLMRMMGVTHLIMSNAAGALNQNYREGDVMIIRDHINLIGLVGPNPLRGPNDPRWGERFVSTTEVYSGRMRDLAVSAAEDTGLAEYLKEGVYCIAAGPSFETVAECRMISRFGADAVGMSTVNEALVALHSGITVFAFSLITNVCCLDYDRLVSPNHEEHLTVGAKRIPLIKNWIQQFIQKVAEEIKE